MIIIYLKNCDIYYKIAEQKTYLIKRDKKLSIVNTYEDYIVMKKLIEMTYNGISIETLKEAIPESEKFQYLRSLKLLMDKGIIAAKLENNFNISDEMFQHILQNYDNYEEILKLFSQTKLKYISNFRFSAGIEKILSNLTEIKSIKEAKDGDFIIGDFTKDEVEKLLQMQVNTVLVRESEGTVYISFLSKNDKELIDLYYTYKIKSNSRFIHRDSIVPINIIDVIISNYFDKSRQLLCIKEDGSIQTVKINSLELQKLNYYDRSIIKEVSVIQSYNYIESMVSIKPHIISGINVTNGENTQSPIMNVEIVFGHFLGNRKVCGYSEDVVTAGMYAFTDGLENILNETSSNKKWVVATNLNEYYAKGYTSMLRSDTELWNEVVIKDCDLNNLMNLTNKSLGTVLKILLKPIYKNYIGKIIIVDQDNRILYSGNETYKLKSEIRKGLWIIISGGKSQEIFECEQTGKKIKVDDYDSKLVSEDLKKYFQDSYIILDENAWIFQPEFEKAGIHIGCFYKVS